MYNSRPAYLCPILLSGIFLTYLQSCYFFSNCTHQQTARKWGEVDITNTLLKIVTRRGYSASNKQTGGLFDLNRFCSRPLAYCRTCSATKKTMKQRESPWLVTVNKIWSLRLQEKKLAHWRSPDLRTQIPFGRLKDPILSELATPLSTIHHQPSRVGS